MENSEKQFKAMKGQGRDYTFVLECSEQLLLNLWDENFILIKKNASLLRQDS